MHQPASRFHHAPAPLMANLVQSLTPVTHDLQRVWTVPTRLVKRATLLNIVHVFVGFDRGTDFSRDVLRAKVEPEGPHNVCVP